MNFRKKACQPKLGLITTTRHFNWKIFTKIRIPQTNKYSGNYMKASLFVFFIFIASITPAEINIYPHCFVLFCWKIFAPSKNFTNDICVISHFLHVWPQIVKSSGSHLLHNTMCSLKQLQDTLLLLTLIFFFFITKKKKKKA